MGRTRRNTAARAALITALIAGTLAAVQPTAASAATDYTEQTLHFKVVVGPNNATTCDVIGDLFLPTDASPTHRVPAILATNGFGGSKDDQDGFGPALADRDYALLSYSGLGFGGSGCRISLDDPDWDGKAASQLVSYLGGAPGIAYTDVQHTKAAPQLQDIVHDAVDHHGVAQQYDPRVGMIGGSYGGEVQFAAAADDPRIDTIVPLITWNDLSYSLDPNNTDQTTGVSTATPGTVKLFWGLLFSADGIATSVADAQADPTRVLGCPDFVSFVCQALVTGATAGYFTPDEVADLRHASVSSYYSKIDIPVLLGQGENDTLFNLNEAVATYNALKAQGTPVKMIWQSWGHSGITPAPGEFSTTAPDPANQYEWGRFADWFDHYLKDSPVSTGPEFAYFRDWVNYTGNATPAYGTSSTFPVGTSTQLDLSGKTLVPDGTPTAARSQSLLTPPAGLPTSIDPIDALNSYFTGAPQTDKDTSGTSASWTTAPLSSPVNVVGSPTVHLTVKAPVTALTQAAGPAGDLVVFVKVEDVAPNGSATLIHGLIAPVRVPNSKAPITVTLPAIVHQFAVGDSIRLVVAGGSENYRGGLIPTQVTIASGPQQTLTLPTVP